MKNMLIATVALAACQLTFAFPPKPAACPSVGALSSSNFEVAVQDPDDGSWMAGVVHNNYDTNDAWTFVIAQLSATSAQDALKKADASKNSLTFYTGPMALEDNNAWACIYFTAEGNPAAAITPALGLRAAKGLLK